MGSLCQADSQSIPEVPPVTRPLPSIITAHIIEAETRRALPKGFDGAPSALSMSTGPDNREAELVKELSRFMEIAERKQ